MIIITGPQSNDDERDLLAEMAGLLGAIPAFLVAAAQWITATALYCLTGWDSCPLAVADVVIAESFGLAAQPLAA